MEDCFSTVRRAHCGQVDGCLLTPVLAEGRVAGSAEAGAGSLSQGVVPVSADRTDSLPTATGEDAFWMAEQILQVFRCWLKKVCTAPCSPSRSLLWVDAAGGEIKRVVLWKWAERNPPPPPLLPCDFVSHAKLDCTPEVNVVFYVNRNKTVF